MASAISSACAYRSQRGNEKGAQRRCPPHPIETVAVSADGVRSRAAQVVEIYCDRCSISNPGRTDCGIVIPNCSKYLVTWATVAIKPRSCTLCVSRSFWLARVTRSLVTRAMPSCSLLGTASKSAPRSNQRNQKNFIRVGFSTSGLLDTSGTLAGAR